MQELTTERDKLYYSAACLFFSDNIWLGNKVIVKMYGENMSKTLFKLFKNYVRDENNKKDYVCPVSDDGHLCFCRQLFVCCC